MAISPARQTAFRILKKILLEEGYASELLHSESTQGLKEEDKRLATELVFGVVRHCQLLDWLLSAHSQRSLSKLDPEVLLALRLGIYQILFLTRVPSRAIVHESVELVKHAKLASAAGFVNAVLRKIDKQEALTRIHELPLDSAGGLSIRFSHPEWLVERWIHQFGLEPAKRLLEHNNTPPALFFRINSPHLTQAALMDRLTEAGVKVRSHPLSNDILEVIEGDLHKTELFREHAIHIQDSGSQLIPTLLNPEPGDCFLDLCAGLGGKSARSPVCREGTQMFMPQTSTGKGFGWGRKCMPNTGRAFNGWLLTQPGRFRSTSFLTRFWSMSPVREPGRCSAALKFAGVSGRLNWQSLRNCKLPCYPTP